MEEYFELIKALIDNSVPAKMHPALNQIYVCSNNSLVFSFKPIVSGNQSGVSKCVNNEPIFISPRSLLSRRELQSFRFYSKYPSHLIRQNVGSQPLILGGTMVLSPVNILKVPEVRNDGLLIKERGWMK